MNKLITIKKADVQPLKILAVLADKDLKNYIQDILSEHVRVNSNVWWVAFFSNCYQLRINRIKLLKQKKGILLRVPFFISVNYFMRLDQ